jgi:hypothetical protein
MSFGILILKKNIKVSEDLIQLLNCNNDIVRALLAYLKYLIEKMIGGHSLQYRQERWLIWYVPVVNWQIFFFTGLLRGSDGTSRHKFPT